MKIPTFTRVVPAIVLLFLPAAARAASVYSLMSSGTLQTYAVPDRTAVLTFDDGPSQYTEKILAILKEKNVNATFFIIGNQAMDRPILKAIEDQGNEVGNHTFTHKDISSGPDWVTKLEINMDRLIIESQTGKSTRLFRPPYLGLSDTADNETSRQVAEKIGKMGYLIVDTDLDSEDWQRPGTKQIFQNSTAIDNGKGVVILLHDGGGDRGQTVEALPQIIDWYRSHGYRFQTVGEVMGLAPVQVMPPVLGWEKEWAGLATGVFSGWRILNEILHWLILLLIAAIFGRLALVVTAALVQSKKRFRGQNGNRPCTVIVPAYNEGVTIQESLKSLLRSHHPDFQVICVDDGSKDATYDLARQIGDPRLRVVRKENGGKASALNYGIALAVTEIIVAVDADTIFRPETLQKLCRHFDDPRVGAVSGNTKIANRDKLLTKMQTLEYIVGFNLDRRMADLFDCITVVPGAIGAFRLNVLRQVRGFAVDTLAEDTDLTLAVKEAGYTIVYDSEAVAYTEAPSTVKDLLKQRFRWTFGTMQAVWKHRRSFLNPKAGTLGLIGLPYLVFYQIIFPLVGPFFDLGLLAGLLLHQYRLIVVSVIIYTAVDFLVAWIAVRLDKEKAGQLWVIIPQRVIYRQLMYYVIAKSILNVFRGSVVSWGSLKRQGNLKST